MNAKEIYDELSADGLFLDSYQAKSNNKKIQNLKDVISKLEQYLSKNKADKIVDEELKIVKSAIGELILKMFERGLKV